MFRPVNITTLTAAQIATVEGLSWEELAAIKEAQRQREHAAKMAELKFFNELAGLATVTVTREKVASTMTDPKTGVCKETKAMVEVAERLPPDESRIGELHAGNVNTRWNDGAMTLLLAATEQGRYKFASHLLSIGAVVDLADRHFGHTPLIVAVVKGYKELATLFLFHGANPLVTSQFDYSMHMGETHWTALHYAVYYKRSDLLALLINAIMQKVVTCDEDGYSTLSEADTRAAMKPYLDAKTSAGYSPLHLAYLNGDKESARILMEAGADKESVLSRYDDYSQPLIKADTDKKIILSLPKDYAAEKVAAAAFFAAITPHHLTIRTPAMPPAGADTPTVASSAMVFGTPLAALSVAAAPAQSGAGAMPVEHGSGESPSLQNTVTDGTAYELPACD